MLCKAQSRAGPRTKEDVFVLDLRNLNPKFYKTQISSAPSYGDRSHQNDMAAINVTTDYVDSSVADFFFWSYTQVPCRTTFVNFGPLTTTYTPPPACQTTPVYSTLALGDTTLFQCPWQTAYKSCMPSPSLAFLYQNWEAGQCDDVFTFHSPGTVCPSGWSFATTFEMAESKTDGSTLSGLYPTPANVVVPSAQIPQWSGTHRLCCPR